MMKNARHTALQARNKFIKRAFGTRSSWTKFSKILSNENRSTIRRRRVSNERLIGQSANTSQQRRLINQSANTSAAKKTNRPNSEGESETKINQCNQLLGSREYGQQWWQAYRQSNFDQIVEYTQICQHY